jgi:hypothetical protein
MADNAEKSDRGWLWRLGGAIILLVNIIGLPLRLFWEWPFRGVGAFCFVVGMIVGFLISSRVRARSRSIGMIAFFIALPIAMIAAYLLYNNSVNHVVSEDYSLSLRQFWEFLLYGFINFCWGLSTEVAARVTAALGKPESSSSNTDKPPAQGREDSKPPVQGRGDS